MQRVYHISYLIYNFAEKQQSTRNIPIQYQKEFLRGIPSHATLPRSYSKKQKEKKKAWSLFGNKKTKWI